MITIFRIDPSVFVAAPAYRRIVLLAEREGGGDADRVEDALRRAHDAARAESGDADGAIAAWRDAFRTIGINPSKYRPAVDALRHRAEAGHLIRTGVALVDAGTAVSLDCAVPVGVHVVDDLDGPLELRPATELDTFVGFDGAPSPPTPGELVWACGPVVLTRRWVWRQGLAGSIGTHGAPRSLAVNVDCIDGEDHGAVARMTELLAYCGFLVTSTVELGAEASPAAESPGDEAPDEPLLRDLSQRGLVYDCTNQEGLAREMRRGSISLYVGIDPTATSLHVGSLLPLKTMQRFQQAGHQPIIVVGGATGAIGDPSGRKENRTMLDRATLDTNRAALRAQVEALLPAHDGLNAPIVVDNLEWLGEHGMLDFLRDVGRYFPVGEMVARDSVKSRMTQSGISFTEFSYSILQAYDFAELRRARNCVLQVGGSDQWGNIVAGIDFMRRRDDAHGYGLVWPLLTRADGEKFGKSGGENVWLDPRLTSAWQFWQFWMNVTDEQVDALLLQLSSRSPDAVQELGDAHRRAPERRLAQRALADEVTEWIHGEAVLPTLHRVSEALFGDAPLDVGNSPVRELLAAELPCTGLSRAELETMDATALAVRVSLVDSRASARRLIDAGGLRINGRAVRDPATSVKQLVDPASPACLVQRGRRNHHLVTID